MIGHNDPVIDFDVVLLFEPGEQKKKVLKVFLLLKDELSAVAAVVDVVNQGILQLMFSGVRRHVCIDGE